MFFIIFLTYFFELYLNKGDKQILNKCIKQCHENFVPPNSTTVSVTKKGTIKTLPFYLSKVSMDTPIQSQVEVPPHI